jgi:hypothetical protein
MERLGLWGEGTPSFRSFTDFLDAVGGRGVGALELVAMDMKARGMFVCRTLSFQGARALLASRTLSFQGARPLLASQLQPPLFALSNSHPCLLSGTATRVCSLG